MLSAIAAILTLSPAYAQNYPVKPVRIVTGGPGSNGDFASRLLASALAAPLGQQVFVENRPSGVILGETVAKSPADGHTLLITGSSFWLAPYLLDNVPWDPQRDFATIMLATTSPNLVVVHPSLPTKTIKELIALAKSRPGQLNYASGATGSAPHLAAELFNSMAGVNIVRINYKGAGQALIDLMAGHVQVMFPNGGGAAAHLKSGRLRALAVTTPKPSALFPGVPTVVSAGLAGYESEVLNGIFAPAKTPAVAITRLNQEITKILARDDTREKFFNAGMEIIGGQPERLASAMKAEMSLWGKLIKDLGIRGE
jgi:tripartite-type tricarboxylate transporter receptor subunit TctC